MRLFSYWRSSASWRVRIVLAHKRIPYEYVAVNLAAGHEEQRAEAYRAVNPMHQVPVLEWSEGGRVQRLTQSVAIAEYLEAAHPAPPLLPRDALGQARVRELVEIVNSGTQPLHNSGTLKNVRALGGEEAAARWAADAIAHGLAALEAHLRADAAAHAGRHAIGDAVTLADVFLVPQVYNAERFGVSLAPFPRCVEVAARASELPAFAAAHPDRQPDAPQAPAPQAREGGAR